MNHAITVSAPGESAAPPMVYVTQRPQWEYTYLVRELFEDQSALEDEFNRLGSVGWELVGMVPIGPMVHVVFKRLKG